MIVDGSYPVNLWPPVKGVGAPAQHMSVEFCQGGRPIPKVTAAHSDITLIIL